MAGVRASSTTADRPPWEEPLAECASALVAAWSGRLSIELPPARHHRE